jgi:hypothetical protein
MNLFGFCFVFNKKVSPCYGCGTIEAEHSCPVKASLTFKIAQGIFKKERSANLPIPTVSGLGLRKKETHHEQKTI